MSKKTIIRIGHNRKTPYFLIARSTAQDESLSFEARGMLVYLLSKPDNWEVDVEELTKAGNCSKNRVYRILKELRKIGYIAGRQRAKNSEGKWEYTPYTVYETPTLVPCTQNEEAVTPEPPYPHFRVTETVTQKQVHIHNTEEIREGGEGGDDSEIPSSAIEIAPPIPPENAGNDIVDNLPPTLPINMMKKIVQVVDAEDNAQKLSRHPLYQAFCEATGYKASLPDRDGSLYAMCLSMEEQKVLPEDIKKLVADKLESGKKYRFKYVGEDVGDFVALRLHADRHVAQEPTQQSTIPFDPAQIADEQTRYKLQVQQFGRHHYLVKRAISDGKYTADQADAWLAEHTDLEQAS